MGMKNMKSLLYLTLIFTSLQEVRSACKWSESISYDNECFLFNSTQLSYSDAKSACQSKGGVLAKVVDKMQIQEASKNRGANADMWIGADDLENEGTWVWVYDREVATELADLWMTGGLEPSNCMDEDCAKISYARAPSSTSIVAGIEDEDCRVLYPFICMEREPITTPDPTTATTTGVVVTSTSTGRVPIATCGANFIDTSALLVLCVRLVVYLFDCNMIVL
ncbi:unnamed protein product [Lymnaea stagnalis]|uniref:C-type lectin domain-containing protein n=1 Tax=Lymnaea stagnalis TaxID=6523 RepID=A0AAV2I4P9_LYMST